jgi:hypothetical protein
LRTASRSAAQQVERHRRGERRHAPSVPVCGGAADRKRSELRIGDARDPARTAEPGDDLRRADDHEPERERRHCEIVTAKTQRDESEHHAEHGREQRAECGFHQKLRPERNARGPGGRR